MDETLRSIRLSHNALIALCVAVIGFALSPTVLQYDEALLIDLRDLRMKLTSYDPELLQQEKERLIDLNTGFTHQVRSALEDLGLSLRPDVRPSHLIYLRYPTDVVRTSDGDARSLSELLAYLKDPPLASLFKPDALEEELTASLEPIRGTGGELISIRKGLLELTGRPTLGAYFDVALTPESFEVHRKYILSQASRLPIQPRITEFANKVVLTFDIRIHGDDEAEVADGSFATWLASNAESSQHSPTIDPVEALVPPRLLAVVGELGGLSIDEAITDIVQKKARAHAEEKVSLFSVDIPAATAAAITPLVVATLLLNLISQLLHVRPTKPEQFEILDEFPWLGLFPDQLSRLLTVASLAVLPVAVNISLLIRLWPPRSFTYWFGGLSTLLVAVAGIAALRQVTRIRLLDPSHGSKPEPASPGQPATPTPQDI